MVDSVATEVNDMRVRTRSAWVGSGSCGRAGPVNACWRVAGSFGDIGFLFLLLFSFVMSFRGYLVYRSSAAYVPQNVCVTDCSGRAGVVYLSRCGLSSYGRDTTSSNSSKSWKLCCLVAALSAASTKWLRGMNSGFAVRMAATL